jgi:predicted Zn-dependent protease with MMP-like domain
MNAVAIAKNLVAGLPPETKAALADVEIFVRAHPNRQDLERGATPDQRGYFWGIAPEPTSGTELPDETPASGEIVLFASAHNTALELERTLLHEIAHVTGHSEEEISCEMGLGA